jgi:hypothetical protein
MNSSIIPTETENCRISHHTFTNVEFSGFFVKFEICSGVHKTWLFTYYLFIKYGDKVYIDYADCHSVGEKVISFAELQKNKCLKFHYDLSLMLTKNKNLVIQTTDYINEPIYRENRYWVIDTAYIYDKGNTRTVEDNEQFCYLKINPYDLENMEYTPQEPQDVLYWEGRLYVSHMGHDNVVFDYYINLMEKELDRHKELFEAKKNILNITALNNNESMQDDIVKKLHTFFVNASKKYYGIIDTIEFCKNKLE